jgi:hypothetical protein
MQIFGASALASRAGAQTTPLPLVHRTLGRTGRWIVPFGLGGQASLQFPAAGLDAADIVVRAVELGVNYLDTANAYGLSQSLYGEAFRRINVTPASADYNGALREQLYVTSKTLQRYAYDAARPSGGSALTDLKQSLTLMFGDGRGYIPEGAYLDVFQIHHLTAISQVDQIYAGLDQRGGKMPDRIGALAGLLDFRDGTNFTGLNPDHKHYIRHR